MAKKVYDCPECGKKMKLGEARVHGTTWGALFFGMSYQNLYFYPDNPEKRNDKSMVIHSEGGRPAQKCVMCGMTLITG